MSIGDFKMCVIHGGYPWTSPWCPQCAQVFENYSNENENRWKYVRDVLWKHIKRSDLPQELMDYFYEEDIKYPTAYDLDRAIDKLRKG